MTTILKVENITKKFGGLIALNNVNIAVSKGEIFGIIGPNGSGKTTLFNIITGLIKPDSGRIYFEDRDITKLRPYRRVKLGISRTFQNFRVYPYLTVYHNVIITARAIHRDAKKANVKASWALTICGLLAEAPYLAGTLPPYKLRMTEFARALVSDPKLILLDEPFAGLSSEEIGKLMKLIIRLNRGGITFLIIEHKLRYLMKLAKRVAVLSNGEKIYEGEPKEVVKHPKVIEAYMGKGVA